MLKSIVARGAIRYDLPRMEPKVTVPARAHMTADEFIPWAMAQPEGCRYELVAGQVVAMSPERAGHNESKRKV